MQSDSSDEVVEIKKDEVQCNHRIEKLYSHRNCTKSAELCQLKCKNNLIHDYPKYHHDLSRIQQFKQKFANLQETSTKQTQHYIRQLNDIENNAHENIARKKEQCLREINQFKKDLMQQTYVELAKTFPNLYEKYKSQRFDTLSCNEVFWVMNTNKHQHPLKPSQINSKLLAILKKFETFKDVSKNLSPNLFINKEKAKYFKMMQKEIEPTIKVKTSNISIEKPNYYQEKSKKELQQLDKRKLDLQNMIKDLKRQTSRLSDQLSNKLFQKRQRQNRIKICRQTLSLHLAHINDPQSELKNITRDTGQNDESFSSSLSASREMIKQSFSKFQGQKGQFKPSIQLSFNPLINKEATSILPKEAENKKNNIIDKTNEINQNQSHEIQKQNLNKDKDIGQKLQIEQDAQSQDNQHEKPSLLPQGCAQEKSKDLPIQKGDQNEQNQKQVENQVVVKQEADSEGFKPWDNKQLVQQLKKYGNQKQTSLKVEYIDGLRKFQTVHLNMPKMKINPYIKNRHLGGNSQKPRTYQLCALQLFQKQCKRKNQNADSDKKE